MCDLEDRTLYIEKIGQRVIAFLLLAQIIL